MINHPRSSSNNYIEAYFKKKLFKTYFFDYSDSQRKRILHILSIVLGTEGKSYDQSSFEF